MWCMVPSTTTTTTTTVKVPKIGFPVLVVRLMHQGPPMHGATVLRTLTGLHLHKLAASLREAGVGEGDRVHAAPAAAWGTTQCWHILDIALPPAGAACTRSPS